MVDLRAGGLAVQLVAMGVGRQSVSARLVHGFLHRTSYCLLERCFGRFLLLREVVEIVHSLSGWFIRFSPFF
jgi:hypothetical protein